MPRHLINIRSLADGRLLGTAHDLQDHGGIVTARRFGVDKSFQVYRFFLGDAPKPDFAIGLQTEEDLVWFDT